MPGQCIGKVAIKAILLTIALITIFTSGWAKGFLDFKLNPEYKASYPENWYRTDPESKNFVVSPIAEKNSGDPPIIQIRTYDLTSDEAALTDSEFIALQLVKHKNYLEDNYHVNYQISTSDSVKIENAEQAFCFHTVYSDDYPAVSETNYARKGKRMFIFRFWSPIGIYEKYLTDYYVMLGCFELKN